jgi:nucleoside 2-deoxyribosyltransferase
MSLRAIVLGREDVVMGIINCVEMVRRLTTRYVNRCDCVVAIVDSIDMLARRQR